MTKPTKWHVRSAKTQISLGIRHVRSVFTVRMKKALVLSYPLRAQWRLGTQSFCWFSHEAAHLYTWAINTGWGLMYSRGKTPLTIPHVKVKKIILLINLVTVLVMGLVHPLKRNCTDCCFLLSSSRVHFLLQFKVQTLWQKLLYGMKSAVKIYDKGP